ncbi:MAG: polymer-forming cytoskeletal protein [Deltaproteobacteria bacterium]|nr:polymer-forming cytoskeletal protein [Deltaproteobacteria bacterium]
MTDPITIIGSNTVVSGNLEGDEDLTVEGRVEGSITLARTLTIEANGVVRANINVRNAIINGVLVGNISAQEAVHITEEGRVVGDITAPRVIIVDGASFRGNVDMGDFDIDRGARASSAQPARETSQRPAAKHVRQVEEPKATEESSAAQVAAQARVRKVGAPAVAPRPVARPVPRPQPPRPPETKAEAPVVEAAKKKPPEPKVRAIGKTKAVRKKA